MNPPRPLSKISPEMLKTQLYRNWRSIDDTTGDESVERRIVVVTGANGGIGKAVVTQLAKRGAVVVMAARSLEKIDQAAQDIKKVAPNAQLIPVKLDLSDFDSVRSAAAEILKKVPHVNLLINNAAYMGTHADIKRTKSGLELHMATNHLGHFLFTLLLLKHLKKGAPSRVVIVAASIWQMATLKLDDLHMEKDQSTGVMNFRAYGNSKHANFLFSRELAKRVNPAEIRTFALCPGIVNTELHDDEPGVVAAVGRFFAKRISATPDQGAETVLYCALSNELAGDTGKAYRYRSHWKETNEALDSNEKADNNEQAKTLWEMSEEIVGVKFNDCV